MHDVRINRRGFLIAAASAPALAAIGCSKMRSQAKPDAVPSAPHQPLVGITSLQLLTGKLEDQRSFYEQVLGLPIRNSTANSLTIAAGTTQITFGPAQDVGSSPYYHFAFNIPENKFDLGKAWLKERVPLIVGKDGRDEFDFVNWNARACYFFDPAGNIVEFIARHDLPNAAAGPFESGDVLYASEIGLVVDDVPAAVYVLGRAMGMTPYKGASPTFTAVGDPQHLLIVVPRGRTWFATDHLRADVFATRAALAGVSGAGCRLPGFPYRIDAAAGE